MVVALAALVTSAGGTVTAAALITSADIKNNTIRTVDIRNGAVKGIDVRRNTLTGADVRESTLGQVPLAANAGKVDGFDANQLVRAASAVRTINSTTSPVVVNDSLTVTAPRDGGFYVTLGFGCASFSGSTDTRWDISISMDGTPKGIAQLLGFAHAALATVPLDSTTIATFIPAPAGTHTLGYRATRNGGNGSLDCNINIASAFVPFGDSGAAPASVSLATTGQGADRSD
jgi:hypothetical protein